jgi:hypothetical protein
MILILRFVFGILSRFNLSQTKQLFLIAIIALFSINYFIDFIKPPYPYYWSQKQIIDRNFINKKSSGLLFSSDDFSREMTEYFFEFSTDNLKVLPMSAERNNDADYSYYLLVSDLNKNAQHKLDSLMKENKDPKVQLVDREKNIFLYIINKQILKELNAIQK